MFVLMSTTNLDSLFISKAEFAPPTPSHPVEKVDGRRIPKSADRQKTQADTKEAVDATGRNNTRQEMGRWK